MVAPFQVEIVFDRGQQYSSLRVEGTVYFYLEWRELNVRGERLFYYQMVGQKDLTDSDAKVEGLSWGTAKALFRKNCIHDSGPGGDKIHPAQNRYHIQKEAERDLRAIMDSSSLS